MGSEWRKTSFAQLCDIKRGASPRPIQDWVASTGIPWIKISDANASRSRFIIETRECIKVAGRSKSVTVYPGDLILSNSATPGIPKFLGIEACIHDGWLLLRNFRGLDKQFAYYLLLTQREALIGQGNGSVFTNLKTEILKNHEVTIPPLDEQHRIAEFLGWIDERSEIIHSTNTTLEAITQALFKSWFVNFDPVHAKAEGREPEAMDAATAALFPSEFEESELGLIPKGWQVSTLSEHVDAERGLSYKGAGLTSAGDGLPMHNLNSVLEGGGYKYAGIKYYNGAYKERHLAEAGDIIVANTEQGHHHRLIGFPAIVPHRFTNGIFSHHLYRVRAKKDSPIARHWLYYCLMTSAVRDQIIGCSNGSTVNMLKPAGLQIPQMVVPPAKLCQAFDGIAEDLRTKIEGSVDRAETLAQLRDTLLPRLISGKLRLPEARELAEAHA